MVVPHAFLVVLCRRENLPDHGHPAKGAVHQIQDLGVADFLGREPDACLPLTHDLCLQKARQEVSMTHSPNTWCRRGQGIGPTSCSTFVGYL